MTPIRDLSRIFRTRLLERMNLGRVFGGVIPPAPAPEEEIKETP